MTLTQTRILIGAVATLLVTLVPLLPVDPTLQTVLIGVITAVAGYMVPKDAITYVTVDGNAANG
jgi:hypothetical protein